MYGEEKYREQRTLPAGIKIAGSFVVFPKPPTRLPCVFVTDCRNENNYQNFNRKTKGERKMKREQIMLKTILALLLLCIGLQAQPTLEKDHDTNSQEAASTDIESILHSLRSSKADESYGLLNTNKLMGTARLSMNRQGYLVHLGAPPLHDFPVSGVIHGDARATARNFISEHRAGLGVRGEEFGFVAKKASEKDGRSYVRLEQTYAEIPVFAAETLVQMNGNGGVEYIISDIMRDTESVNAQVILTTPSITDLDAEQIAITTMVQKNPGLAFRADPAVVMLYQPSVVGNTGRTRLVWQTTVASVPEPFVAELVLVDAHSCEIVLHYPLTKSLLDRWVLDCASSTIPKMLYTEGEPPTGVTDIDLAYDYLEDCYKFYQDHHGRDSIDNNGMTMKAYVRVCFPDESCPWPGAQWSRHGYMAIGEGYVVDDVIGHELTHGVTHYESGLIYMNESGAISESLSDMWGEWIDQTNGGDSDSPDVKWLLGEDLPGGAIRSLKNPPDFYQPDRKSSPYWRNWPLNPMPDRDENDWGGVHYNSGVGNKLCYLLTDGEDLFNEYKVEAMGITRIAELFYEVQTHLLTPAADYHDLYSALRQAATTNLRWSYVDIQNLEQACSAVEIDTPDAIELEQREYRCQDLPTALTDNGTTYSGLHIENLGAIIDLNVRLNISHTRDGDLDVFLIAPDETRIELFSDIGGDGDDLSDTVIDDDTILSIADGTAPFTGSYHPVEGLSLRNLYGKNIKGTWILEITDDEVNETGVLNSWSLDIVSLVDTVFALAESFSLGEIDLTKWMVTQGAPQVVNPIPNAPIYFLKLSGGYDAIESKEIDLSGYSSATLTYLYCRTGLNPDTASGQSPDAGDDLIFECWDQSRSRWVQVDHKLGSGSDMRLYRSIVLLNRDTFSAAFKLRIRTVGTGGDWLIDNVMITCRARMLPALVSRAGSSLRPGMERLR